MCYDTGTKQTAVGNGAGGRDVNTRRARTPTEPVTPGECRAAVGLPARISSRPTDAIKARTNPNLYRLIELLAPSNLRQAEDVCQRFR